MDSSAYCNLIACLASVFPRLLLPWKMRGPCLVMDAFSFLFSLRASQYMMSLGVEGLNAAIIISSPNLTPSAHSLTVQQERDQTALGQTDDPIGFINIIIGSIFLFLTKQKEIQQCRLDFLFFSYLLRGIDDSGVVAKLQGANHSRADAHH